MNLKQYLGDSVYADMEDGMIKLTTENGYEPNNTIYMEPAVYHALLMYVKWVEQVTQPAE